MLLAYNQKLNTEIERLNGELERINAETAMNRQPTAQAPQRAVPVGGHLPDNQPGHLDVAHHLLGPLPNPQRPGFYEAMNSHGRNESQPAAANAEAPQRAGTIGAPDVQFGPPHPLVELLDRIERNADHQAAPTLGHPIEVAPEPPGRLLMGSPNGDERRAAATPSVTLGEVAQSRQTAAKERSYPGSGITGSERHSAEPVLDNISEVAPLPPAVAESLAPINSAEPHENNKRRKV